MSQQGVLLVLSGPSGAGKGTICKELLQSLPELKYSISATTRAPRTGEVHGVNYLFVSREEFTGMIDKDELLEWAEVYGNYYGTPCHYVEQQLNNGQDVVLEIDIQGAMQVKKKFPQGIFLYIMPPSLEELADRIYKRGTDSLEVIKKRLSCASGELSCAQNYNYIVVNDEVAQAVKKVQAIIVAEKCKATRNLDCINNLCKSTAK
ncbi:MAG: guanylate kinase [Pelosinus sp.]|nr:guanylate kinase [Pelosinus sp.]